MGFVIGKRLAVTVITINLVVGIDMENITIMGFDEGFKVLYEKV